MVRPWEVMNPIVDLGVWIASAFRSKLEDSPVLTMLVIEKLDELVCRISIGLPGPV
jgi:hypothetical protein